MNKFFFLVFAMSNLLFAMEPEAVLTPLIVKNTSNWDVEVHWKTNGEVLKQTLQKGHDLTLPSAEEISSLKIAPHGMIWGKISAEELTRGLLQLPDEVEKIKAELEKHPEAESIVLNIALPSGFTGGYLSPFIISTYSKFKKETETDIPESRLLEDTFPAIKKILYPAGWMAKMPYFGVGERAIEARHFLNVPIGASRASIEYAYNQAKKNWEEILNTSEKPGDKIYARDVLHLLELAHTNLISELDLKDFVDKKMRTLSRYPEQ